MKRKNLKRKNMNMKKKKKKKKKEKDMSKDRAWKKFNQIVIDQLSMNKEKR